MIRRTFLALLLAGCAGLLFHAHDAQPMLIALAAYGGGLGALAALGRRPLLAGTFYGLAITACLLGTGIAPTLPLLALAPVAWWLSPDRPKALHTLLIGLGISLLQAITSVQDQTVSFVPKIVAMVVVGGIAFAMMKALRLLPGSWNLRLSRDEELEGIDVVEHGLPPYHLESGAGVVYFTPTSPNFDKVPVSAGDSTTH